MIARLIEWCAKRRLLVIALSCVAFIGALLTMRQVPLDAIPDLSDPQVIVYTEWMGRSPDLVEDQVTYPIVSSRSSTSCSRTVPTSTGRGAACSNT